MSTPRPPTPTPTPTPTPVSVPVRLPLPTILDDRATAVVRHRLDRLLADPPETVVLDCSEVRFIDSSGLRLLIEATRAGHDYGSVVVTYDPDGALDHLKAIVDLEGELTIQTLRELDVRVTDLTVGAADPGRTEPG